MQPHLISSTQSPHLISLADGISGSENRFPPDGSVDNLVDAVRGRPADRDAPRGGVPHAAHRDSAFYLLQGLSLLQSVYLRTLFASFQVGPRAQHGQCVTNSVDVECGGFLVRMVNSIRCSYKILKA